MLFEKYGKFSLKYHFLLVALFDIHRWHQVYSLWMGRKRHWKEKQLFILICLPRGHTRKGQLHRCIFDLPSHSSIDYCQVQQGTELQRWNMSSIQSLLKALSKTYYSRSFLVHWKSPTYGIPYSCNKLLGGIAIPKPINSIHEKSLGNT